MPATEARQDTVHEFRTGTLAVHPSWPVRGSGPSPSRSASDPVVERRAAPRRDRDTARRVLNVVVAAVGIVLSAPLMLVVAALVRLSSPGPVIYKQPRVGLDRRKRTPAADGSDRRNRDKGGRIFTIYKFRTMRADVPAKSQVWACKDDPRITAIGRFLRASRLDELPQLFNVLKGDMNIVGPPPSSRPSSRTCAPNSTTIGSVSAFSRASRDGRRSTRATTRAWTTSARRWRWTWSTSSAGPPSRTS